MNTPPFKNPSYAETTSKYYVAVIGAGPAGLYAAKTLAGEGVQVTLFNRDIKPGGLAEYGIYPTKLKMKDGLRNQFRQILNTPGVDYYGNVTVGQNGDLRLDDLREMGFQALLVTVGAQGTKWLGMPGEELKGVYHAKDVVYHYNQLPPFSETDYLIGKRAAVIGGGNVMLDITHWLAEARRVDEVTAIIRRGPAEARYEKKELEAVAAYLDREAFEAELQRVTPLMLSLGQDPQPARDFLQEVLAKAEPAVSSTRFRLRFLGIPYRILGDANGRVAGLEVEDTTLIAEDGDVRSRRLGTRHVLDVDTVIFAIGDRVDPGFGLPVDGNQFVKAPQPRFPQEGLSYEVLDPGRGRRLEDTFVAGWARQASKGLVGVARKDGTNGAHAVLQYLHSLSPLETSPCRGMRDCLEHLSASKPVVTYADVLNLEAAEQEIARQRGLQAFKFDSNWEMLDAMRFSSERILVPCGADQAA